ncbi:MAG: hypothetical protein JNK05_21760 [Myxococcales bacterium]|nr:hypothetical protein [Myxococcales bacterium]
MGPSRIVSVVLAAFVALFSTPASAEIFAFDSGALRRCTDATQCMCNERCETEGSSSGYCIAQPLPFECESDNDCVPCTGRVCVRGACFTPTRDVTCATACTGCQTCLPRVGCSVPNSARCAADAECPRGMYCDGAPAGRCRPRAIPSRCSNDEDCATCDSDLVCTREQCRPRPTIRDCTPTSCPGCLTCEPGVGCIRTEGLRCASNADCNGSNYCNRNVCTFREIPSCTTSADCIACTGRTCFGGQCRLPSEIPPPIDAGSRFDSGVRVDSGRPASFDAASDAGGARRDFTCSVGPVRKSPSPWIAALFVTFAIARHRVRRATRAAEAPRPRA